MPSIEKTTARVGAIFGYFLGANSKISFIVCLILKR